MPALKPINERAPMVVRVMGGLGNQMFQYAFGRRLKHEHGAEVRYDVESGFSDDKFGRRLGLGEFRAVLEYADKADVPTGMRWRSPWHLIAKWGRVCLPKTFRRVWYERDAYSFDGKLVSAGAEGYYVGYWQNCQYVDCIAPQLRDEFRLAKSPSYDFEKILDCVRKRRSISLHVRRYNDLDKRGRLIEAAVEYHGTCKLEYYKNALERVGVDQDTTIWVFTDNLEWAQANLKIPGARFVADLGRVSAVEELILMSSCDNHVISNSSFSWWGAWLGSNPAKIVIAPKTWVANQTGAQNSLCPSNWLQLDNI